MLLRFLLVHSLIFLRDWGSPSISRPFLFHKKKRTGHFGASLHSAVSTVWVEMFDSNWHKKSSEKGWNRAVFGEKMCCLRAPKLFDFRVSVGSSPRNEKYIYMYIYITHQESGCANHPSWWQGQQLSTRKAFLPTYACGKIRELPPQTICGNATQKTDFHHLSETIRKCYNRCTVFSGPIVAL